MFPIVFFLLAILGSIVQMLFFKTSISESLLLSFLVVEVGLQGIYAFIGHYFLSDKVAQSIGWEKNNPFQKEIAFVNLAFGVLGIGSIWLREGFWIATIIGYSVFLLGAAIVHLTEIKKSKNLNIGNAGPILFADILVPILLIVLAVLYFS